MNKKAFLATLASLAIGGIFTASAAFAGTCTAPTIWNPDSTGAPTISGTTCGGDTTASGYCAGNFDAPGPAFVVKASFTPSGTFTKISASSGGGYDLAMYLTPVSAGCGTNGTCTASGDATAFIPNGDVPDTGDFYIIITAATFDSAGQCGNFTLSADGTFPVKLQKFEVL